MMFVICQSIPNKKGETNGLKKSRVILTQMRTLVADFAFKLPPFPQKVLGKSNGYFATPADSF